MYVIVILNGKDFGCYFVGCIMLMLDVMEVLKLGENRLVVKVEYFEMIVDMFWVCGGCFLEWGFSEGFQFLGIFCFVVLEVMDEICIEFFGVYIWNDDKVGIVFVEMEVKNYGKIVEMVEVVNKFSNVDGKQVFCLMEKVILQLGERKVVK